MAFTAMNTGNPLSDASGFSVTHAHFFTHTRMVTSQRTTIDGRGFCHMSSSTRAKTIVMELSRWLKPKCNSNEVYCNLYGKSL